MIDEKPILVTIRGTGTNYVMQDRSVIQLHVCNPRLEEDAIQAAPWITTYRDPHLVAATWMNRCSIGEINKSWYAGWDYYANVVLPRATAILRVADFTGPVVKGWGDTTAKDAYMRSDMETYYKIVPRAMVNYVLKLDLESIIAAREQAIDA